MQIKNQNYLIAAGVMPKDAEFKMVGQDGNIAKCSFGMKTGENASRDANEKPEAIWLNCIAWREMAGRCQHFKKGDHLLVAGYLQSHEYQGKTYTNLVIEFAAAMAEVSRENTIPQQTRPADFVEIPESDEEEDLPF